MNDFLTKDKRHLRLFQDNIVIDKRLLKWRRAEQGVEKTKAPNGNTVSVVRLDSNDSTTSSNINSFFINTTPDMAMDHPVSMRTEDFDPDGDLNAMTSWLPLYETPEGVKFDELATAGIRDLTKLIVEKKIKYVMAGYGSFGNTIGSLTYSANEDSDSAKLRLTLEAINKKMNEGPWYKRLWNTLTEKKEVAVDEVEEQPMDALKFFTLVKTSSKESAAVYKDRVSKYLTALHNATNIGQTALQEELIRGLITNRYESVLYAEGCYYAVTEEQVAKFASQCEKGLKLSYLKNFSRPIPQDVIDKVAKMNELEVFDNYVVLYYDPEGTVYKETAYEEAKRRDPIIFGVIAGSKKLYYVADWIDEYCDLTLDAFVDALGIEKDDLHFDAEEIKKAKEQEKQENKAEEKPKKRNYKRKKKNNKN
jgi:hypothetical protein